MNKITAVISDELRKNIEALTKDGESFNDTVRRLLAKASKPKTPK
jgi:high-affinity K+ transport system ATPase subunit B